METIPMSAGILATGAQSPMKTITAFQASDGELFPDQESAESHEFFIKNKGLVEGFLSSNVNPYQGAAHKNMIRGSILRWEIWKLKNAK